MSADRRITVTHDGVTYGGQMATIRSTHLGVEDHGIVTAYLHCEWPGGGIGVGGFCLDSPVRDENGKHLGREGTAYGLDHIMRVVQTVGAKSWEGLTGEHVIVLFSDAQGLWLGSTAAGIAHATEDRVFILREHAEEWQSREHTPTATPAGRDAAEAGAVR